MLEGSTPSRGTMTVVRWQERGKCRGADPELFFPTKGDSGKVKQVIKDYCDKCEVAKECLDYAVRDPDALIYGIWGGKTSMGKRKERKRQGEPNFRHGYKRVPKKPPTGGAIGKE